MLLVFILAVLLQSVVTEHVGGTNCLAYAVGYGPECRSNAAVNASPGVTIQYFISVTGNIKICCKALVCDRYPCRMKYIGCGRNSWSSGTLTFAYGGLTKPKMQCTARFSPGSTVHTVWYSFRHTH